MWHSDAGEVNMKSLNYDLSKPIGRVETVLETNNGLLYSASIKRDALALECGDKAGGLAKTEIDSGCHFDIGKN